MVVARNQGLVDDIFHPRQRPEKRSELVVRPAAAARKRSGVAESILLAVTASVLLLLVLSSLYGVISHAVTATAFYDTRSQPKVAITVKRGDTLWSFAHTYGAPSDNVLDNVEAIAVANHLSASASLVPGEVLRVPVSNPRMLVKLGIGSPPLMASRN